MTTRQRKKCNGWPGGSAQTGNQDVLAKTRNPMLRNYVYNQLARTELQPADPDKAIATLRTSLNENITRINMPVSSKQ